MGPTPTATTSTGTGLLLRRRRAKCIDAIAHPNARLIEGISPLAKWMMPLAEKRLAGGKVEDVAYFVPFYLKDFVAKTPRKLL